jgi:hypothetical protein
MAMEKPTLREQLIRDILELPDDEIWKLQHQVNDFKKSQIPLEDEELTEEEKKALKQFESGGMSFEDAVIRRKD